MLYMSNPVSSFFLSNRVVSIFFILGLLAFIAGCDSAGVDTESELPQPKETIDSHFA